MAFGRLLDKDKVIINHYFECGFIKDEAWRRAGRPNPQQSSWAFFARPEVKAEIKRRMDKLEKKADITAEELISDLRRLKDSAFAIAKYKRVNEEGKLFWDFTGATEEELVAVMDIDKGSVLDPNTAIDKLLKILGAYKPEKLEHTGKDGVDLFKSDKEAARAIAFILAGAVEKKETE